MRPKIVTTFIAIFTLLLAACVPGTAEPIETPPPLDAIGMQLDKAETRLKAEGWKVEAEDARESRAIFSKSNWIVITQELVGETVILGVEKNDDEERAQEEEQRAQAAAQREKERAEEEAKAKEEEAAREKERAKEQAKRDAGPSLGMAQLLCEREGEREFPFGFKMHSIMGVLAETWDGENLFLKYEITVTNAFNAKQKGVMECSVNGKGDDITLDYFLAY